MRRTLASSLIVALAGAWLSACAPPPTVRPAIGSEQPPPEFPAVDYQRAIERGEPVFRVDAKQSRVVIEVRRGGTFAQAGHDHVVASHDVEGMVAPGAARADLYVKLDQLVVDEPDLRAEAGFDRFIPEAAIAGTRANMLGRVLHADKHPFALVSVNGLDADRNLKATIVVNGVNRTMSIPVDIHRNGDELAVSGALPLDQTDFAIAPLSLFNGAIQVQNRVDIRFAIHSHRVDGPDRTQGAEHKRNDGPGAR